MTADAPSTTHLCPNRCNQSHRGRFVVQETADGGKGSLEFHCPVPYVLVNLSGNGGSIVWLKSQRRPDAIVLELLPDGETVITVVELKSTLSPSEWGKAKEQFEVGVLNGLALMGVLGRSTVSQIRFVIAFRKNNLVPEESPSPALLRASVQPKGKPGWQDFQAGELPALWLGSAKIICAMRNAEGDGAAVIDLGALA